MNAPGTVLTWVCAAVVALPLSPCAFFSSTCCRHEEPQAEPVAQANERPCCANHSQPAHQPVQPKGEKPCQGVCCQLSPFVNGSEKLIVASPLPAIMATVVSLEPVPTCDALLLTSATPQSLSFQILHCQWRC